MRSMGSSTYLQELSLMLPNQALWRRLKSYKEARSWTPCLR